MPRSARSRSAAPIWPGWAWVSTIALTSAGARPIRSSKNSTRRKSRGKPAPTSVTSSPSATSTQLLPVPVTGQTPSAAGSIISAMALLAHWPLAGLPGA